MIIGNQKRGVKMATLAELQADLVVYKTARDAILSGAQSYGIAGRSVTRANLDTINKEIARLEARIGSKSRIGGNKKAPLLGAD
jgi:hypothetical protein